jgi:hypothetical protein
MRKKGMGRKKMWAEDMQARFPEGTFERIDAVLEDGEERTQFVREAVERELKRRARRSSGVFPCGHICASVLPGRDGIGKSVSRGISISCGLGPVCEPNKRSRHCCRRQKVEAEAFVKKLRDVWVTGLE